MQQKHSIWLSASNLISKWQHQVSIKGENVEQTKATKLLGVTFDDHLKFQTHSQQIIKKPQKSVHGLLTQKRHGVNTPSLVKFYKACNSSANDLHAAPAWYSFTAQYVKDELERHQSHCLRLIYPDISSYTEPVL